ncbi:MAG: tRNA lysidine(34) synthetase TilS [bacterium]|nr:tRNA lysidine(34) synthetase TilS [bacterium]
MQEKVYEYMKKHRMTQPGDRVIAAVSGGADSVCLFWLLAQQMQRGEILLRAVHVHHGLRGEEADRDAAFTEKLCQKFDVPCRIVRRDVAQIAAQEKLSVEEAGRMVRYQILEEMAKEWDEEAADGGACRIATAHHQGDSAETILYHLFRGSGLRGLSGIAPVRERIIRPILCVQKNEITAFLEKIGLDWCEDSTNGENHYMRNRIRNELLPWAKKHVNAQAAAHIVQAGERIAQAENFLEYSAANAYKDVIREETPAGILIQREPLLALHPALRPYVVRLALEKMYGAGTNLGQVHLEAVMDLFEKQVGRERNLPGGVLARRVYEGVHLETGERKLEMGPLQGCGMGYEFSVFPYEKGMKIPQNQYTKWFDYDKIKGMVSVRHRKSGDFITISGGGRKSVKEYMIHEKIPRECRDKVELVADGSHVLWIVGWRISEMYKVTEDTKRILQIRLDGGTQDGR